MKVTKFRIKNYKSIVDSEDCYFADKFTILAGKNESGKTTILQALADLHEDSVIKDDKKPLFDADATPEIIISCELTEKDIQDIAKSAKIKLEPSEKTVTFDLRKTFENKYFIDELVGLSFKAGKTMDDLIKDISLKLEIIPANLTTELTDRNTTAIKEKINQWLLQGRFINTNNNWQSMSQEQKSYLQEINKIIDSITPLQRDLFLEKFIELKLPYFILFSSFDDVFPDSIDITDLNESEWVKDLAKISELDIKKISDTNKQAQSNHQSSVNIEFSEKFNKYWTQDKIKLEMEKDGDKMYFWIIENGKKYGPSQRSKGQQWYLSFYIRVLRIIRCFKFVRIESGQLRSLK